MTAVEQRLRDALVDEADGLDESEDLFAARRVEYRRRPAAPTPASEPARGDRVPRRRGDRGGICDNGTNQRRTRYGLVGIGVVVVRGDGVPRLMARAVHPTVREELRRGRLPSEPSDREELHRPHGRGVLPDLLRVHPVHGAVRTRCRMGSDGQCRATAGRDGPARRHPVDRRAVARVERVDAADDRAHPHAEPPARRADAPEPRRRRGTTDPTVFALLLCSCLRSHSRWSRPSAWPDSGRSPPSVERNATGCSGRSVLRSVSSSASACWGLSRRVDC